MKLFLCAAALFSLTQAVAASKPNTTIYLQVPACGDSALSKFLIEGGSTNVIYVNEDCSSGVIPGASLPLN